MNIKRNNETEPLAPMATLAETRMVAEVLVEVGPVDDVGRHVGLGVPDEGDSLPPRQRGRGAVGPPLNND